MLSGLSPLHLLIILAIVVLLFGGSKLAGLGKSTGRALREFKEETKDLRGNKSEETPSGTAINTGQPTASVETPAPNTTPNQTTAQQGEFVNPVQPTEQRRDA